MCVELKIKIKSLATEARIIRAEERKFLSRGRVIDPAYYLDDKKKCYATYEKLRHHRLEIVRREARATHLAYAFIRGKSNPEGSWSLRDLGLSFIDYYTAKQAMYRMVVKYHPEYTNLYYKFKERNTPIQANANPSYIERKKKDKEELEKFYKIVDNWLSS